MNSGTWGQFSELERTVYNSLYTLVRDTAVLRDYTHAALTIVQASHTSLLLLCDNAAYSPHGVGRPAAIASHNSGVSQLLAGA
jgi:hypothetical protein